MPYLELMMMIVLLLFLQKQNLSIPSHHAGDFAGEQNSLHALVVKRESSEKSFPYLLGAQLLRRAVGVEHFQRVSKRGPEILKTAIKDFFKRVAVVFIQGHPSIFFSVVDRKVSLGHKSAGEGAAREDPTKLDAEDQEEALDMARKVFMRLYTAAFKGGIIGWKIGFTPGAMSVLLAVSTAACTGAKAGRAAGPSSSRSDMSPRPRPKPGRSTPAPLRVRVKARLASLGLGWRARARGLHRTEVQ